MKPVIRVKKVVIVSIVAIVTTIVIAITVNAAVIVINECYYCPNPMLAYDRQASERSIKKASLVEFEQLLLFCTCACPLPHIPTMS